MRKRENNKEACGIEIRRNRRTGRMGGMTSDRRSEKEREIETEGERE